MVDGGDANGTIGALMDNGQAPSIPEEGRMEGTIKRFPTVGIGTSAGGVHALQMFFESLRTMSRPRSLLWSISIRLAKANCPAFLLRGRNAVTQVSGLTPMEPRHVYVIPPNRQLRATDHHLAITEFDEPRWQRAPIDLFFRSLATEHGDDFAIILSGAGSDGSVGIKAIKEAGGIILVQDPDGAEYGSMPRSAVATGLADFVLPVREIAERRRLIEDALPYQFGARTSFAIEPDGAHCTIALPISGPQTEENQDGQSRPS